MPAVRKLIIDIRPGKNHITFFFLFTLNQHCNVSYYTSKIWQTALTKERNSIKENKEEKK